MTLKRIKASIIIYFFILCVCVGDLNSTERLESQKSMQENVRSMY